MGLFSVMLVCLIDCHVVSLVINLVFDYFSVAIVVVHSGSDDKLVSILSIIIRFNMINDADNSIDASLSVALILTFDVIQNGELKYDTIGFA